MKNFLLVASCCLLSILPCTADEATDWLDRAIAAHGGREALAVIPPLELQGSWHGTGRMATAEVSLRSLRRNDGAFRREAEISWGSGGMSMVELYDGDSVHKRRFGSGWDDLPTDEPEEMGRYDLGYLLIARERGPKLLGEVDHEGHRAMALEIDGDSGPVSLWLDADTARLLGIEFPGIQAEGMGTREEVTRRITFSDYRSIGSLLLAFSEETNVDGTLESTVIWESIEVLEEFDPQWVALPDLSRRYIPSQELVF